MTFTLHIGEEFAHTRGYLVYRHEAGKLTLFGFEPDAISLYPTRERAEEAAVHASVLRGGEWRVGSMYLVVPSKKEEG